MDWRSITVEAEVNHYFVDGEWRYYKNGKRVKESI